MSMTIAPDPNYVVLTISGRVWQTKVTTGYFGILGAVFEELQSAGSNWDAPWTLLRNGKVVVESKLSDLAYAFGTEDREARGRAYEAVRAKHCPAWLLLTDGAKPHATNDQSNGLSNPKAGCAEIDGIEEERGE